jgi:O-antigen/teichoic acid export membrane protein
VAIINIIDPIFSRIDQLLVAHFSGSQGVAAYNIAVNSIGRLSILPLAMSRSLFPKLSTRTIDDYKDELYRMKGQVILAWSAICVVAILASDLIFRLWLHNAIAAQVSDIAKIFTVGVWANCLGYLPYTALQASGRSGAIIKAHLIEMPFYLVILIGFTYSFGPVGAAAAWGLRNFADYLILWKMCRFPLRRQGLFASLFIILSVLGLLMLSQVRTALLGG